MPGPTAKGATFLAQTFIEPDRIAILARDVSLMVRGGLRGNVIQFDGATTGQLAFSIRSRVVGSELMSFRVHIARRADGFTNVDVRECQAVSHRHAPASESAESSAGYATYKRYTRELAAALARFDPQSTAILVETSGQ